MEYKRLTEEQQAQVRENALANIEQEHLSTAMARTRAEVSGDEELVDHFTKALESLEAQYAALEQ